MRVFDVGEVAAHLGGGEGEGGWCLTSGVVAAIEVRRALAEAGEGELPVVVAWPSLMAAARRLPAGAPVAQVVAAARLLPGDPPPVIPLAWRIYEMLRPHCPKIQNAARLQLARKLAELFLEVDRRCVLTPGENPFVGEGGAFETHEMEVAAAVWAALAEAEEEVGEQPLLRRLGAELPAFAAVGDDETTPVQWEFFGRHGRDAWRLPAPEAAWEAWFADAAAPPPALDGYAARVGCGETLEEAARLAMEVVMDFLAEHAAGTLGIVVFDRLLARRLRALAQERPPNGGAEVLIADAAGWRAESTAYGAALAAAAAVLLSPLNLAALRGVLCAPFFGENEARVRAAAEEWRALFANAVAAPTHFEGVVKLCEARSSASSDLPDFPGYPALGAVVGELARIRRGGRGRRRPEEWLAWLLDGAAEMLFAWREDALADVLRGRLRAAARKVTTPMEGGEFGLWLRDALVGETVVAAEVESRVSFVSPETRRRFGRLLLLGGGGKPVLRVEGWLGEREREALGLETGAERMARARRRFCRLVAAHSDVAAVWCAVDAEGRPVAENPFWGRLARELRREGRLRGVPLRGEGRLADGVAPPSARVARGRVARLPATLRLSSADVLMRCPYAFYAGVLLRLGDAEEPEWDEVSPRLRGVLLHEVMQLFATESAAMRTDGELRACLEDVLRRTVRGKRPALWLQWMYWREFLDGVVAWEQARRRAGWRLHRVEEKVRCSVAVGEGAVTVVGRLDRWDVRGEGGAAGEAAVIDYKSGGLASKSALRAGEVPQLALYACLLQDGGAGVGTVGEQALFRPLHKDAAQVVGEADAAFVGFRMRGILRQIARGRAMPAAHCGCGECVAAGVSRREHWL